MTSTTVVPISQEEIDALNEHFASRPPQELIAWAAERFPGRVGLSCSFGGTTGMVLIDMAMQTDRAITIYYADTNYLFPETYATIARVRERYGVEPLALTSDVTVEQQAAEHGPELWLRDPDLCCAIRKVAPVDAAMHRFDAYITGLRRDQASTRTETPLIQWDTKFGLLKLSPLASWTEKDVWAYIMQHELIYNPLHDQGYPSIGCTNCTRAVAPGEDPRAGRWSGTDKVECGLHVP